MIRIQSRHSGAMNVPETCPIMVGNFYGNLVFSSSNA